MDIRKLQKAIVDGLEDVKAQDIVVFNTEHLSPLFERVIIASGTSNRQTKALAASVRDAVREAGLSVLRTEGEDNGEWIIVDCGAAVCHVMQPAIRQYYSLEEIWGGKPVAVKTAVRKSGLAKASEPMDEEAPAKPKRSRAKAAEADVPAAKKAPAKKAPAKRAVKVDADEAPAKPARKAPAKTAAKTAVKSAAKPAAAKTAAKKAPAKKAGKVEKIERVVIKPQEPATKKPAAKKAPAKTAAKPAAKAAAKPAAKKAPAKKAARAE